LYLLSSSQSLIHASASPGGSRDKKLTTLTNLNFDSVPAEMFNGLFRRHLYHPRLQPFRLSGCKIPAVNAPPNLLFIATLSSLVHSSTRGAFIHKIRDNTP
jgi:hypothetical protein